MTPHQQNKDDSIAMISESKTRVLSLMNDTTDSKATDVKELIKAFKNPTK